MTIGTEIIVFVLYGAVVLFCLWYGKNFLAWRRKERERLKRMSRAERKQEAEKDWWDRQY